MNMTSWTKRLGVLAVALGLMTGISTANATTFGFAGLSNNNATNTANGEAQLSLEVVQSGSNVLFNFINSGVEALLINDVYFDDDNGLLDGYVGEINVEIAALGGVDFGPDAANPQNVPASNSVVPSFSADLSFDAKNPGGSGGNGVDQGETLGLILSLVGTTTVNDILLALDNQDLRVGLHVQGFDNDGSESFVNISAIPLPSGILLLLTGMGSLVLIGRRHRLGTA